MEKIITVRLKVTPIERERLLFDSNTMAMADGNLFAELDFYRQEAAWLECCLKNILDNPASQAKQIADAAWLKHRKSVQKFQENWASRTVVQTAIITP